MKIDLDGIDQRILSVPMPPRRYVGLQVGKAGYAARTREARPVPGRGSCRAGPRLTVHRYDLKTRKSDIPLTGVSGFQMSSGGEKALYRQGENWIIAALRPMATGPGGAPPRRRRRPPAPRRAR